RPDEDIGVVLLIDIRSIFDRLGADRIASAVLVDALHGLDESMWLDWRGPNDDGPPRKLNQTGLSRLLRSFDVRPRTIRLTGDRTKRGYWRSWFEPAWAAYCPSADTPTQPIKIIHLASGQSDT